jgi:hypothetical protein|tara:strand:+ start:193 stop:426 length:234 start_codon:yes stop_codon:yes gene_type:complete
MKAILIKYLSATETKPARYKATTDAGSLLLSPDHCSEANEMVKKIANKYIEYVDWDCVVSGVGGLPNGDYVATIKNK